jgi:hypothetical protein
VKWGEYPPGMDEVILTLDASSKRYVMRSEKVSKPNQPYKPVGMLAVLRAAVERFGADLAATLDGREVRSKEVQSKCA